MANPDDASSPSTDIPVPREVATELYAYLAERVEELGIDDPSLLLNEGGEAGLTEESSENLQIALERVWGLIREKRAQEYDAGK